MSDLCCVHITDYKKSKGTDVFSTILANYTSCIEQNALSQKIRECFCHICITRSHRLHACVECSFVGCFDREHIQAHADLNKHSLAIDITFGNVYCFSCKDYMYNLELNLPMRYSEDSYLGMFIEMEEPIFVKCNICRRTFIKRAFTEHYVRCQLTQVQLTKYRYQQLEKLKAKLEVENVKEDLKELIEDELICNICTEVFIEPITLGCSHTFCKFCISEWKKEKRQCPMCRASINTETHCLFFDIVSKAVEQLDPASVEKRLEVIKCREEQTLESSRS